MPKFSLTMRDDRYNAHRNEFGLDIPGTESGLTKPFSIDSHIQCNVVFKVPLKIFPNAPFLLGNEFEIERDYLDKSLFSRWFVFWFVNSPYSPVCFAALHLQQTKEFHLPRII